MKLLCWMMISTLLASVSTACTPITLEWHSEYWPQGATYVYQDTFRLIIRGVYNKVLNTSPSRGPWQGGMLEKSVHPDGWDVARTIAKHSQLLLLTVGNGRSSQSFRFEKANKQRTENNNNKISLEYWQCLDSFNYPQG